MTEWREDVKKVLIKAGMQNMPITFLFSDTQVSSGQGSGWVNITPSILVSWMVVSVLHAQDTANGVGLRRDSWDQGDPQLSRSGT